MHIEPGIVTGAKLGLSVATSATAGVIGLKMTMDVIREKGLVSLVTRAALATLAVFVFFEVFPKYPVGVSEVHFILGSTLFLILGAAPAAIGLAAGLALQGLLFAPFDLPQYGMNITTLLVPLFGLKLLADRIIPQNTAYVDVTYTQSLALSAAYQGGIVAWVAFWAVYGQGFGADVMASISTFGFAYLSVLLIEPVVDVAVLAFAKTMAKHKDSGFVTSRLFNAG